MDEILEKINDSVEMSEIEFSKVIENAKRYAENFLQRLESDDSPYDAIEDLEGAVIGMKLSLENAKGLKCRVIALKDAKNLIEQYISSKE